jgi:hypothetical protein
MSQSFYGAQPKVVQNKAKYNAQSGSAIGANDVAGLGSEDADAFNIMYDKRVFRGNTYNLNLLK